MRWSCSALGISGIYGGMAAMALFECPHASLLASLKQLVDAVDVRRWWDIYGEERLASSFIRGAGCFDGILMQQEFRRVRSEIILKKHAISRMPASICDTAELKCLYRLGPSGGRGRFRTNRHVLTFDGSFSRNTGTYLYLYVECARAAPVM